MSGPKRSKTSRNPLRNRNRRDKNTSKAIGKVKSGKKVKKARSETILELASVYKKRTGKVKKRAVERRGDDFKRRYESTGPLFNSIKQYAIPKSTDSLVGDNVQSALTIQSDRLIAHQYMNGDRAQIIIDGLMDVNDNGLGIVDTISAIVDGFGHKDLKKVDLFIATKNSTEEDSLEDFISLDNDILDNVTFVERHALGEDDIDSSDDIDDDNNDNRDFILAPTVSTVMDSAFLMSMMKEVPKEKSVKYQEVVDNLNKYHSELEKFKDALISEIDPNHTRKPETGDESSEKISEDLANTKTELLKSIQTYISDSKTLPHKSGAKKAKKGVMGRLQKQLESLNRRKYNEVRDQVQYVNTDIEDLRGDIFLSLFNTLTEDDIDRAVKKDYLGEGAGGKVNAVTFKGPPPFKAALKIDGVGNMEAADSGIPRDNPQQSKRAVAAFAVNQLFNLDVIPDTRFYIQNNPDTSLPEVGHAMAVVSGQIGQLKGFRNRNVATEVEVQKIAQAKIIQGRTWPARVDFSSDLEFEQAKDAIRDAASFIGQFTLVKGRYMKDIADQTTKDGLLKAQQRLLKGPPTKPLVMDDLDLGNYHIQLREYKDDLEKWEAYQLGEDDEFHKIIHKPPSNINLTDGVVQKSLSDLQLLDNIIGHADRHGENFIFETNDLGDVTGIKGIDNSDTFGDTWKPKSKTEKYTSKTPGIPPVIDLSTAVKILSLNKPSTIEAAFKARLGKNLTESEIRAAFDRLTSMQKQMVDGIVSGDIRLATRGGIPKINEIGDLQSALQDFDEHIDTQPLTESIMTWGGKVILDMNTEDNSYLGTAQALGVDRGFQNPDEAL